LHLTPFAQVLGAGIGTYAAYKSDRRLKKNIKKVGQLENGLNVYSFNYIWGQPAIGVMADEVEKVIPEAVMVDIDGFKAVDYGRVI